MLARTGRLGVLLGLVSLATVCSSVLAEVYPEFQTKPLPAISILNTVDYFPLEADTTWTYRVLSKSNWVHQAVRAVLQPSSDLRLQLGARSGAPEVEVVTLVVSSDGAALGRPEEARKSAGFAMGGKSFVRSDLGVVREIDLSTGALGDLAFPSEVQAHPTVTMWSNSGQNYWISEAADVNVPAGRFTDCLVAATRSGGVSVKWTKLIFCKGVGLVLEVSQEGGSSKGKITRELLAFHRAGASPEGRGGSPGDGR